MSTADSLKRSMDVAVKRYSSLFRLPSDREVLLLLALFSLGGGSISALNLLSFPNGVIYGLLAGLALFCVGLASDCIAKTAILREDSVYNLRRTFALSFFSWVVWFFFILVGSILAFSFGNQGLWMRLCLLGFSASLIFRLVVFSSTSSTGYAKVIVASLLEPLSCLIPFLTLWAVAGNSITLGILIFLPFSTGLGLASVWAFLHSLDRLGRRSLGVSSLSLFRAFMLNWVAGLNAPFEQLLEKLGERKAVETVLLEFASNKTKTVMVVPSIHPGPFKNIGSSPLPSLIKTALEKQLDCVACVPHGLLGHEFDLASQQQNQKIIQNVVTSIQHMELSAVKASPFVKETNGLATACCQVFGKSVIVSFTLAPRTIEDLPEELGLFVRQEAVKHGLELCAVVNAHNSIDGDVEMGNSLNSLKDVAGRCLEKATSLGQNAFEVGAATIVPKEFSLEDGMGAGGITVVVVNCGKQKTAYVVIDGNNIVSGFREEILSSLSSLGIDEGEIFTTDTHAVSALILEGHGYHPIGEVMDRKKLIGHIKETTIAAIARLGSAKAGYASTTVSNVTVLGAQQLETLCLLIDKSIRTARRIVVPLFAAAGLVLMLFLLFV